MTPLALDELQRAPALADQIYLQLRFQLRSGVHAPGERLVESALASALSVSRSPVREALARLVADGFLDSGGIGYQVVAPTAADMAEIFEMRRLLEPTAARHVARLADASLLERLSQVRDRVETAHRADDFSGFLAANYDFRAAWVERVPNRRLAEAILKFDDQAGFVRRTTLVHATAREEVLHLLALHLDAFGANDEAAAARAAHGFIDGAERYYRDGEGRPD
ncbi:GntR family transcriptional regulator [Amorphus sp. 3PC139-8]|uniref:GntR family transcriptional regulator n=1 Tax=Amorphus sp. 3PC139-8 TaxID=2735676 RepID=UPI00345CA21B